MTISLFDTVENTVGKGENAGNQHFLLFQQYFSKPSSLRLLEVGIVRLKETNSNSILSSIILLEWFDFY